MSSLRRIRRSLSSLLALAAIAATPATMTAPNSGDAAPVSSKATPPERVRRGRAALRHMMDLGGFVPGGFGNQVGYDWIYRRTKNFRRKGVGSRWRHTMRAGKR